uniref:Uncharacterized protein n=1 Tax=Arundo donax TaxID=35708 RepID=A0A0A8YVA8_ARUDO
MLFSPRIICSRESGKVMLNADFVKNLKQFFTCSLNVT